MSSGLVSMFLVGVAVALLLVGAVSGTVVRHLVQVMPIALALAVVTHRPAWGANAALPIFVFWAGVVMLIWLYLLDISAFAQGRYSTAERALTLAIGGCALAGIVSSVTMGRGVPLARRVLIAGGFALLQLAAMWASFRPVIANL